jgi:hypothetical protein
MCFSKAGFVWPNFVLTAFVLENVGTEVGDGWICLCNLVRQ